MHTIEYFSIVIGIFLLSGVLFWIFYRPHFLMAIKWRTWFIFLLIATSFDVISTHLLVDLKGIVIEGNPVVRYLFEKLGFWATCVVHKGSFLGMVYLSKKYGEKYGIRIGFVKFLTFFATILQFLGGVSNINLFYLITQSYPV